MRLFLINADALSASKERVLRGEEYFVSAFERLKITAEKDLILPIRSVIDKAGTGPSRDKHDYVSLAPYWWPDPNRGKYVRYDGRVNPERYNYDVTALEDMTRAVRNLSFAYYFSDDERYGRRAAEWLRTWFVEEKTIMNPHMRYAQFVPGMIKEDGHGIIETVRFRWMIDNIIMLAESGFFSEQEIKKIKGWFSRYLRWLIESREGKNLFEKNDNKTSWLIMQIMLFALFSGREDVVAEYFKQAQRMIETCIDGQGLFVSEIGRTRSLHYNVYHLQGLMDIVVLGRSIGRDLWRFAVDGKSLKRAVDFLIPFVVDGKDWPYEQIDEIRYPIFCEILRRASVFENGGIYEDKLEKLRKSVSAAKGDSTTMEGYFDLVEPPVVMRPFRAEDGYAHQ